jgi:hypothetical protein
MALRTLDDTLREIDAGTEVWCVTGPITGPAPAGHCHLVVTPEMLELLRQHLALILDRESGGIAVYRRPLLWDR